MDSDVKSFRIIATGLGVPYRTRLRGLYLPPSAAAASLILHDGALAGTTLLAIDLAVTATCIVIPGSGILFPSGIWIDNTGVLANAILFLG